MIKNKELFTTIIAIMAIILACVSICFFITNTELAFAAGMDDLNENTIVNFNQLYSDYDYNSSGTFSSTFINDAGVALNLDSTHTYYVSVYPTDMTNVNSMYLYPYNSSTGSYGGALVCTSTNVKYSKLVSGFTSIAFMRYYGTSGNTLNVNFYINCIDLTLMFGTDIASTITLEQCQDYFTANYYSYTAGTAMPYSKGYLQGYTEGQQDIYESLTATYNSDILGTISYAAFVGGFTNSSVGYDTNYSAYLVEGLAGINFGDYLTTTIDFKATYFIPNYAGGGYLVFFKYDGSSLIPLSITEINTTTDTSYNGYSDISFNINNLDTIYFGVFNSATEFKESTNFTMFCFTCEMQLNTINVAALSNAAYGRGYSAAVDYYSSGNTGYTTIYNAGYAAGVADNSASVSAMNVAASAFNGVGDILRIELLPGFPIGAFVLIPLMLGLIFFVVKVAKGGN